MALSDSFRKVAVYFGLAENRDYYEDDEPELAREPEREAESRYEERPNVRRLQSRRRRDEIDDIFGDDAPSERRTAALRTVGGASARAANGRGEVRVHLVVPKSFNDAQDVADKFKDAIPVILNLQSSDTDLSKRLIDFGSGLTYALDGGMQRIADKVFLLTPRNVEVSAEERAALIEKGFFNQS
jgi:cell division inhibitor SepF